MEVVEMKELTEEEKRLIVWALGYANSRLTDADSYLAFQIVNKFKEEELEWRKLKILEWAESFLNSENLSKLRRLLVDVKS
jgi:hypothetical protein